ncbi:twin-arginine translocase TatA/TatE family subunit [Arthrobacter sp. 92]|uniref:twin-arginine translocase TatA/TatE family subunit n=1 Tax=Arthrobacter sp. 92 TaxID=3418175 RepID=UPI003CFFFF4D
MNAGGPLPLDEDLFWRKGLRVGRLLDGPWPIVIICVVGFQLFAAPKLPSIARSLGQSVRIIRSEVREMKNDGNPGPGTGSPTPDDSASQARAKDPA